MSKVHTRSDHTVEFKCPGCGEIHVIPHGVNGHPSWTFNGDYDKPTLYPSVLYRSGHFIKPDDCWCRYNEEHPDDQVPFQCVQCHSFVTDGKIQFLSDCSHALAGQTVDLLEWGDTDD